MLLEQWRKKLARNLRDEGLGCTVSKALRYAVRPVLRRQEYLIYAINLGRRSAPPPPPAEGIAMHVITAEDQNAIRQIEDMEEWLADQVEPRLRRGALCVVAWDGDVVAGFNLVSFGEIWMPLVRVRRRLRAHEAWSDQVTVQHHYRGRGLGTHLRLRVFEELRQKGIRKLQGGTLPSNAKNLGLSRKVGLRTVANIRYTRVLRSEWWTVTRVR